MSSQESKRMPNKPNLLTTTKRSPVNKNSKKATHLPPSPKNNLKKNSSDSHIDVFALHPKYQKAPEVDFRGEFNSNSSPRNIRTSAPKKNSNNHLNYTTQEYFYNDEISSKEVISNYSQDNLSEIHHTNQEDYHIISTTDNFSSTDDLDSKLGQKIREIFNEQSNNDIIISNIKIIIKFIDLIKSETNSNDSDFSFDDLEMKFNKFNELRRKSEEFECKLKKLIDRYNSKNDEANDDQHNSKTDESFHIDDRDLEIILQLIEKDLTFSMAIRNIFNENDNDEAIIRTIQSNKESADDNNVIIELSSQLQLLRKSSEIKREIFIDKLKDQHQNELDEKELENQKLTQIINDLKNQIENLNFNIEKDQKIIDEMSEKYENEKRQFESFKDQNLIENIQQKNDVIQSYESQINLIKNELFQCQILNQKFKEENQNLLKQKEKELNQFKNEINDQNFLIEQKEKEILKFKEDLSNNEILMNQLRNEIFEQQRMNEQKQKEISELRIFIKNGEDIKDKEIDYLKQELLSSLDKQKKIETQLNKLTKKYEDSQKQ